MGACIGASPTDTLAKQHSHQDPIFLQTLKLETSPAVTQLSYGIHNISSEKCLKFNNAPLKNSQYLFNKFHSNESPEEVNLEWEIHSIDLINSVLNVALVNLVEVGVWVVWGGKCKILGTGLVVAVENYIECEYVRIENISKVGKENLLHFVAPEEKCTQLHLILESLVINPASPCTLSLLSTYKISNGFHLSPSLSEESIPLVLESQTMNWNNLSFVLEKIYNQDESELNAHIKNQTECIVCLSLISDCILVPCRHMCLCQECIQNVGVGKGIETCPLCKKSIEEVVVYKD